MPVNIHGKEYVTVAERLQEARKDIKSIITEVIPNGGSVVIKATVTTVNGVFTGISSANPAKAIEKASPYEVAETSAVGRALGFAGYGAVDSIASADEIKKSEDSDPEWVREESPEVKTIRFCSVHGENMPQKWSEKKQKNYWAHVLEDGTYCFGSEPKN